MSNVLENIVPSGTIESFGGTKDQIPTGFMFCDGRELDRITYSRLFSVKGTSWGAGDRSSTFNIPDLKGYFLRGVADGSGRDLDTADRTSNNSGRNLGDKVGTIQNDATKIPNNGLSTSASG